MTNSLSAPEELSFLDRLRVAYTIYVRMGPRTIYDLRVRKEAFLFLYKINKERDPPNLPAAEYCAQRHGALMKRLSGEPLETMLGPEFGLG